jgi:hypothetical protein
VSYILTIIIMHGSVFNAPQLIFSQLYGSQSLCEKAGETIREDFKRNGFNGRLTFTCTAKG